MKLLQLNIWQGKLLSQTLQLIEFLQPDLLCLQEVFNSKAIVRIPDHIFEDLNLIQEQTGYTHVYFSPTFTGIYAGIEASFGNAILSRYPLHACKTIPINGTYQHHYDPATFDMNTRNLQIVTVQSDEGNFTLANHHAYWQPTPFGNETSLKKMQLVKENLETVDLPLVFAGDLNVIPKSPSMQLFNGFLTDLTRTHHIRSTLSEVGKVKNVACDHVLISKGIQVKKYEVRRELVSDHRAITLDFSLNA